MTPKQRAALIADVVAAIEASGYAYRVGVQPQPKRHAKPTRCNKCGRTRLGYVGTCKVCGGWMQYDTL